MKEAHIYWTMCFDDAIAQGMELSKAIDYAYEQTAIVFGRAVTEDKPEIKAA